MEKCKMHIKERKNLKEKEETFKLRSFTCRTGKNY
jgi:hypothetical protein